MKEGLTSYLSLIMVQFYQAAVALGGPGVLVIALLDSSFLSVPEGNDVLIIVLSTGQSWARMWYLVVMTVMGSVAGCSILYWVGRRGGRFVSQRVRRQKLRQVEATYRRWGLWAVLVPSILPPPTPFKVFVLSAGVFQLPFPRFFLAISVGRSIRYSTWGILAVLYGEWARQLLKGSLETVGAVLLIVLVMVIVTYLVWKTIKKRGQQEAA